MTFLNTIIADKKNHVAARKSLYSRADLEDKIEAGSPPRGFARALSEKAQSGYGLIAEIKKASPSKGLIRPSFDPQALALSYAEAGAACLSVLTDEVHFQGKDEDLIAARSAVSIPVLRKDFIIDPYQIIESRALGADCILLIMACLELGQAQDLEHAAQSYGLDVLVEVHNQIELEHALQLRTPLLGINNRDLKTFVVDLNVTKTLCTQLPPEKICVSESGISHKQDLDALALLGVRCFLVGESLMRHPDVGQATRTLLYG